MPDARTLPIDTTNYACVMFPMSGEGVLIGSPVGLDTREKALVAAALIVTGLGCTPEEFRRYCDAVANA